MKTPKEIIRILMTLEDYYHLKSNYVIVGKAKKRRSSKERTLKPEFISSIEKRAEVIKRFSKLEKSKRNPLVFYCTLSKSNEEISKFLHMSRRHLY